LFKEVPMPTFENAKADASEAREALRGLAHATQRLDDPRDLYAILGDLSLAAASLGQVLHQLGGVHDAQRLQTMWVTEDSHAARAAAYQVSWDLHRAGEVLRQVSRSIDDAHQAEGTVVYHHRDFPAFADVARPAPNQGLGL
jgi:hypothetical protein